MNCIRYLKRFWQALPLSDHNRWRITSLLLEPILPFIKGGVVYTAYLREREWQTKRIRPFHGDTLPTLPEQQKADVIIWGVIDWRFRIQRPQHLARGFAAAGHRVFYVSTAFVNTRRTGFELERMDEDGRLYAVRFHLNGRPAVYAAPPNGKDIKRLKANLAKLLQWTESRELVTIVQHPYWHELARILPASRLVYDCMDHHEGFDNTGAGIAEQELALLKDAEAVVTTSQSLYDFASAHNSNVALIRNAVEFEFFSTVPERTFKDSLGRRVLGYYGAIAEWMDVELLERIAQVFPECLLLLVGADECGARERLEHLPNVQFTGEVKYTELPYYLYGIDVCLLPFRVSPLTLATNPVKVYEYLAAQKPVVAIALPELLQFDGLVEAAATHDKFVLGIETALGNKSNAVEIREARREFASRNSWHHRVAAFKAEIDTLDNPLVSIVIVTFNNLELTRICLERLEFFTDYDNIELIVVDNASSDGTPDFLRTWEKTDTSRRCIFNSENRGFSAANNQGLSVAKGEYLVLLNNDTEVTPGWLRTLMNHLRCNRSLGLIGPVTNNIGNEAKIRIHYTGADEMRREARNYTLKHMGETFQIRTLAFYCVMLPRQVFERVGMLDEAYGLGFFEDDDYCRRVVQAGWQIACAEDAFIHHHLSASFNKLGDERKKLLEHNRRIYEAKWGPWMPHKRR